ncbi:hypothetical protein T439DRAFT_383135 [Meredithblackwellia eburnea MCA 4105]
MHFRYSLYTTILTMASFALGKSGTPELSTFYSSGGDWKFTNLPHDIVHNGTLRMGQLVNFNFTAKAGLKKYIYAHWDTTPPSINNFTIDPWHWITEYMPQDWSGSGEYDSTTIDGPGGFSLSFSSDGPDDWSQAGYKCVPPEAISRLKMNLFSQSVLV